MSTDGVFSRRTKECIGWRDILIKRYNQCFIEVVVSIIEWMLISRTRKWKYKSGGSFGKYERKYVGKVIYGLWF